MSLPFELTRFHCKRYYCKSTDLMKCHLTNWLDQFGLTREKKRYSWFSRCTEVIFAPYLPRVCVKCIVCHERKCKRRCFVVLVHGERDTYSTGPPCFVTCSRFGFADSSGIRRCDSALLPSPSYGAMQFKFPCFWGDLVEYIVTRPWMFRNWKAGCQTRKKCLFGSIWARTSLITFEFSSGLTILKTDLVVTIEQVHEPA